MSVSHTAKKIELVIIYASFSALEVCYSSLLDA
jgi:hypothetical protein